jgi:hypothetical protein
MGNEQRSVSPTISTTLSRHDRSSNQGQSKIGQDFTSSTGGEMVGSNGDSDLKEWKLPVVQGREAVAILVAEEKRRSSHPGGVPEEVATSVQKHSTAS